MKQLMLAGIYLSLFACATSSTPSKIAETPSGANRKIAGVDSVCTSLPHGINVEACSYRRDGKGYFKITNEESRKIDSGKSPDISMQCIIVARNAWKMALDKCKSSHYANCGGPNIQSNASIDAAESVSPPISFGIDDSGNVDCRIEVVVSGNPQSDSVPLPER